MTTDASNRVRHRSGASPSTDPRAAQTRESIHAAVGRLLVAGKLSAISVVDIAHEAGIGRSTFYAHYRTIDDLALDIVTSALARISDEGERARIQHHGPQIQITRSTQRAIVDHAEKHRALYLAAFRLSAKGQLYVEILEAVTAITKRSMTRAVAIPDGVRTDLLAPYLATATVGMLTSWLSGHIDASKEEVVDHLVMLMPRWLSGAPTA